MSEQQAATDFLDELEKLLDDIETRIDAAETVRDAEFTRATAFIADRAAEVTAIDTAMDDAFTAARGHVEDLQKGAQTLMAATDDLHGDVEDSVTQATAALDSLRKMATKSATDTLGQFNESFEQLDSAAETLEKGVETLQSANTKDLQRTAADETATEQEYDQLGTALQDRLEVMKRGVSEGQEKSVRASEAASQTTSRAQVDELSALTEKASESLAALKGGLDQGMAVLGQIRAAGSSLSGAVSGDARASMQEITNVMHLIGQIRPVIDLAKTLT